MESQELDNVILKAIETFPENDTDFIFYMRGDETNQLQFAANGQAPTITSGLASVAENNEGVKMAVIKVAYDIMKADRGLFRRFQKEIKKLK